MDVTVIGVDQWRLLLKEWTNIGPDNELIKQSELLTMSPPFMG